jgi:DNA-directed RNA polymerase specialized sigma24 family protein
LREEALWQNLPAHNFPAQLHAPTEDQLQDEPSDRNPDLWMYRRRTVSLLRRYMRFSLETGRLPSFIGREFFRAKVTSYRATTFEDRVIFVRDVEKSLERLEYWDQQLIGRIILQEYEQEDAARILHCGLRTVERRLPQVIDLLSEDFLRVGLLTEGPEKGKFSQ